MQARLLSALEHQSFLRVGGRDPVHVDVRIVAAGRIQEAAEHLEAAVTLDPGYFAAWKHYAQVLVQTGRIDEAAMAYERGIAAAEGRGDLQAAKEMGLFLKRLRRVGEKNAPT